VGSSPNFNCSDGVPANDYNIQQSEEHRAPRPQGAVPPLTSGGTEIHPAHSGNLILPLCCVGGGRAGICWPTFESAHNEGPQMSLQGLTSYNAISGLMTVTGQFCSLF